MPISRRHLYAAILITGLSNALAHAIIPRTSVCPYCLHDISYELKHAKLNLCFLPSFFGTLQVAYNAAIEPRFTIETSTPPATTTVCRRE